MGEEIEGHKIKKAKELIEKSKTLRKVITKPEEEVSQASLLNAKNLYRLLSFLRDIYPIGYSFEGLKKRLNIKIFSEYNLDNLEKEGLIKKRHLEMPEEFKKRLNPNFLKLFPDYIITNKGIEFVNSIEVRDLSEDICWLTKILIGFGAITITLIAVQVIFQILQYLKP